MFLFDFICPRRTYIVDEAVPAMKMLLLASVLRCCTTTVSVIGCHNLYCRFSFQRYRASFDHHFFLYDSGMRMIFVLEIRHENEICTGIWYFLSVYTKSQTIYSFLNVHSGQINGTVLLLLINLLFGQ